jgi:hypothetical protein
LIEMLDILIRDLLFAMVDHGGGRHETDLRALGPTPGELAAAARWSITQDPSPGYRSVLLDALRALGVDDVNSMRWKVLRLWAMAVAAVPSYPRSPGSVSAVAPG